MNFRRRSYSSLTSSEVELNSKLLDLQVEQWHALDENGFIKDSNGSLLNKAAIYIYQSILDKEKIYIGSTYDLSNRFNQHRTLAISGSTACPIFYNSVRKYGWNNFKLNILKYIDLDPEVNTNINKEIILNREQYYLDIFLPMLGRMRLSCRFAELSM